MRSVRPAARYLRPGLWLIAATLSLVCASPARADIIDLPPQPAALKKLQPSSIDDLKEIQNRINLVVKKVMPAVVNVKVGAGQGSGVIISEDGFILTAGHVSGNPGQKVKVTLFDGKQVNGITLGANRMVDSGLIKITDKGKWPVAEKGNSTAMKKGDWCLAIGHPNGWQKGRDPVVRLGRILENVVEVLRTDAILVGGDSGGPLFDMDGKVIGIHSRIMFFLHQNFHVPVKQFDDDWARLVKGDLVTPAYLGVKRDPDDKACKIQSVTKDAPADKAGMKADDVITKVGDKQINTFEDLVKILDDLRSGDKIMLEVKRGDGSVTLDVTLGSFPNQNIQIKAPAPAGWAAVQNAVKDHPEVVKLSQSVITMSSRGTVEIFSGGKSVALGTIVKGDGLILTLASELTGPITVKLQDGRQLEAKIIGEEKNYNLALLKVEGSGLTPVTWKPSKQTPVGSFVLSVGMGQSPVAVGIVSVPMRKPDLPKLPPEDKGYLGINIAPGVAKGVQIDKVNPGSGAAKAGLKAGDIIIGLAGKEIPNDNALQDKLKDYKKGQIIEVKVKRGDKELELKVTLGPRPPSNNDQQNLMGSKLSKIKSGFPIILQHDSILKPEDCGGPLVDLEGKVVGINVSRAGRTESYAIPTEAVLPLLDEMIAGKHAPKKTETSSK